MTVELGGVVVGPLQIALLAAIYFLAGMVKGAAAFGIPLVAVPLVSLFLPLPTAAALSVAPIFVSNIVQAYQTRRASPVLRRVWPLYIVLPITLALASQLITAFDPVVLYILIGVLIEIFVLLQAFGRIPPVRETLRVPLLIGSGLIAGMIGGTTSLYAFPTLQLFFALRLVPLEFAFASSLMFLLGSIALGGGFARLGVMQGPEFVVSVLCNIPLLAGLLIGQTVLRRGSATLFRRIVLVVMAAMGVSMILRSVL